MVLSGSVNSGAPYSGRGKGGYFARGGRGRGRGGGPGRPDYYRTSSSNEDRGYYRSNSDSHWTDEGYQCHMTCTFHPSLLDEGAGILIEVDELYKILTGDLRKTDLGTNLGIHLVHSVQLNLKEAGQRRRIDGSPYQNGQLMTMHQPRVIILEFLIIKGITQ